MKQRDHLLSGPATLIVLGAALIICTLVSFLFGRYPVPFRELCGILGDRFLSIFGGGIDQFWTDAMYAAVWNVRLPRVLMSVLVGACLSAAGAAYQGVFQNPMAAPDVLGASAGAGFGAALAIFFGLSSAKVTLSAFGMSLITVALVFWVSRRAKGEKTLGLVLAGIMVSSLFEAGTSFIKLAADPNNKLPEITYWLMGSLSGADWGDLRTAILPAGIGITILLLLRWRLGVLTLGDEEAEALGVKPERVRAAAVLAATLLTAAAIASCGTIGWVGLIIPHLAGRLTGQSYRYRLTGSILLGGAFLLAADNIARSALPVEIPVGILTAFAGAPFFLWLMVKGGRKG